MRQRHLIDPDMLPALDARLAAFPGGFHAITDITERRATINALKAAESATSPHVVQQDLTVYGSDLPVRVYRPAAVNTSLPGIYYIHGGGMILGTVAGEDAAATLLCEQVQAVVVSVDYRLAPEHPYPAALDDCYAGLAWMHGNAAELGVDPDRLAIYGASAGGGLTIATALAARDRGGPPLRFMMPIYPMLDDRHETPSSHEITDIGIWDRAASVEAWNCYLAGRPADRYAAPAREEDLSALPPAFIDVGAVDLFRDEDIAFAQRLMQAGVPTELHVHPGAYHGAESLAPEAELSQRIWALRVDALKRALRRRVPDSQEGERVAVPPPGRGARRRR
ncbi:alpha/beta hydrolase [Actinoplanes sp. NPDC049802]|uniref:alpha/beta hydrolase n=1 Tax=Actinoplanes sp. NPDC049802 TaxID=3154742 RepID=UPI0033F8BCDE